MGYTTEASIGTDLWGDRKRQPANPIHPFEAPDNSSNEDKKKPSTSRSGALHFRN